MKVAFTYISPQLELVAPVWVAVANAAPLQASTQYALLRATATIDERGLNKIIDDVLTSTDSAVLLVTKALQDAVTSMDALTGIAFVKHLADVVSNTDAITTEIVAIREMLETVTTVDAAWLGVTKVLADACASADVATLAVTKALGDQVVNGDSLAGIALSKALQDVVTTAEQRTLGITKPIADAVSVFDSGSMRMTSYADITYFAEDYVGTSRQF